MTSPLSLSCPDFTSPCPGDGTETVRAESSPASLSAVAEVGRVCTLCKRAGACGSRTPVARGVLCGVPGVAPGVRGVCVTLADFGVLGGLLGDAGYDDDDDANAGGAAAHSFLSSDKTTRTHV